MRQVRSSRWQTVVLWWTRIPPGAGPARRPPGAQGRFAGSPDRHRSKRTVPVPGRRSGGSVSRCSIRSVPRLWPPGVAAVSPVRWPRSLALRAMAAARLGCAAGRVRLPGDRRCRDDNATPKKPPSSAADRMRRSRERRRERLRIVQFAVRDIEVDALVSHGLLDPTDRKDRAATARALGRLLDQFSVSAVARDYSVGRRHVTRNIDGRSGHAIARCR
jgi:hypothetical protein